LTENIAVKHQDVSDSQNLLKRGNYSLLRILVTIQAAGPEGIPTRKLLDQIGTHATYTQKLIEKAETELKLIKRTEGGRTERSRRFEPKICRLTKAGKQLLKSQLPPSSQS
jgi:hypothetical protein